MAHFSGRISDLINKTLDKVILGRAFIVLTILLNQLTFSVNGQDNVNLKRMVGFGCYYEGKPTKTVTKVTSLLKHRKYEDVAMLLKSSNEGERYLAVISIQRLSDMGKYHLSDIDKQLIEKAKVSEDLVSVCSGCTYFDKVPMNKILSENNFIGSNYWLDRVIQND